MIPPRLFWFRGITALRPAHARYRELAKQLHPDKGGTDESFSTMATDYTSVCDLLRHWIGPESVMSREEVPAASSPPSSPPPQSRRRPSPSPEMKAAVGQAIDAGASLLTTLLKEWLLRT